MKIPQNDKQQLIDFYHRQLNLHGSNSHESLHWSDHNAQQIRFEKLSEIGDLNNKSILDYGCGLGDLFDFLKKKVERFQYQGVDIVPNFITEARKKYPDQEFRLADIDDLEPGSYDYALASGVFSFKIPNFQVIYLDQIKKLYSTAKIGIAFNMLDKGNHPSYDLFATYDKNEIRTHCLTFAKKVVLIDDYLPQDFTVYLYR